jgi:predicted O-methyltransferase YrrM
MSVHVILRTCSNSLLSNDNKERICGNDRENMIMRCVFSLIEAINFCNFKIKLTILDDHSEKTFIHKLNLLLSKCKHLTEVIHLSERGFNHSAYMQFKIASESETLVYMVEDDYLHSRESLVQMYTAYHNFKSLDSVSEVIINPHDDPYRYVPDRIEPCKIFLGGGRYWRTVRQTTYTLFTHSNFIKQNFHVFETLAKGYPHLQEDQTINKLYNNLVFHGGAATVFSPIPSLAVHLSYFPDIQRTDDMLNWQTRWNEMDLWRSVDGYFDYPNIYSKAVELASNSSQSLFVEVGSWLGRSSSCMATFIKNSKKDIKFYCVDTWKGSDEEEHKKFVEKLEKNNSSLFNEFDKNITLCGIKDYVNPMQMTSLEAASHFEDESINFLHIDASHDYENVIKDIRAWYPKVKTGGIISGDDYEPGIWDGVVQAVNEFFNDKQIELVQKSEFYSPAKIWLVKK